MFSYIPIALPVIIVYMILLAAAGMQMHRPKIAMVFRSPGIALMAAAALWKTPAIDFMKISVLILVILWSALHARLQYKSYRKTGRNSGNEKDLNREGSFSGKFMRKCLIHAILMLIISLPVLHIINNPYPVKAGFIHTAALLIVLAGIISETDSGQRFIASKVAALRNKEEPLSGFQKFILRSAGYSTALVWWGFWLMALPVIDGIFTLAGPLTITLLHRHISSMTGFEGE